MWHSPRVFFEERNDMSRAAGSWLLVCLLWSCVVVDRIPAAEVVRSYPMGEEDNGAAIGEEAIFTADTVEFADDVGGVIVDLVGFGTYVEGRNEDSEFAIAFNGTTDFFEAPRFDPRDFGSFSALSQGWIKPSSEGEGIAQTIWALGRENGGVGITEDGFWQLNSGGPAGSEIATEAVVFDEWVHLAVLRTGNNGSLYRNGSVIATNDGFWNGPGDFFLGSGPLGEQPFIGTIDDFLVSGFGDGSFDPVIDIRFLDPSDLSGVLGDVDQDGEVTQSDYEKWSENVGFDNGLGVGDFSTLFRGDIDQNGRVNFFDFEIIRQEALASGNAIAVPEPLNSSALVLGFISCLIVRRNSRR